MYVSGNMNSRSRADPEGSNLPMHACWTYPVVYIREPKPNRIEYYTSARLKVTARNLPEININKLNGTRGAGFLPLYLMDSTPVAVPAGGTAEISWNIQYIDEDASTRKKSRCDY